MLNTNLEPSISTLESTLTETKERLATCNSTIELGFAGREKERLVLESTISEHETSARQLTTRNGELSQGMDDLAAASIEQSERLTTCRNIPLSCKGNSHKSKMPQPSLLSPSVI